MKKEDIESGMIVEMSNGKKALVINTELFFIKHGGSTSLAFYEDDLTRKNSFTIKKIYRPIIPSNTNIGIDLAAFLSKDREHEFFSLIWERPPIVEELTLEQVCKELGRDIKIVKG